MTISIVPHDPDEHYFRRHEFWLYWIDVDGVTLGIHPNGVIVTPEFDHSNPNCQAALSKALNLYREIIDAIRVHLEIGMFQTLGDVSYYYPMRKSVLAELNALRERAIDLYFIPENPIVSIDETLDAIDEFVKRVEQYNPSVNIKTAKRSMRFGFVYLVKGTNGYYKIGRTLNIADRMKTFSVKLPFDVELEHTIESDDYIAAEKELHKRYAKRRVNGEWFALTEADVKRIKKLKRL